MNARVAQIAQAALRREPVTREDARFLVSREGAEQMDVLYWADRLRRTFCGDRIVCCSILSARQGRCSEDCAFCAQSAHHHADVEEWPLVPAERIVAAARAVCESGADSFGIVTSGRTVGGTETATLEAVIRAISALPIRVCASLGQLSAAQIDALKAAGLRRLHHNLETSRRFFPRICTTHGYEDRIETVRAAKAAGLEVCSGGLFGLGEDWEDRIDLALTLRELEVDAVPLNFLNPRPGTPLADAAPVAPMEILKIIALFRFVLPDREIKVCGGREVNLRDVQSWIFMAGANGFMVGNYLTTAGRAPEADVQMLRDLGLRGSRAGE